MSAARRVPSRIGTMTDLSMTISYWGALDMQLLIGTAQSAVRKGVWNLGCCDRNRTLAQDVGFQTPFRTESQENGGRPCAFIDLPIDAKTKTRADKDPGLLGVRVS